MRRSCCNDRKVERAREAGVTLVEMLVVLAILALVSAVVVINVLPERDRAAVRKTRIDISVLETALDQYRLDMLRYPTTEEGLAALVSVPAGLPNADNYRPGGYIKNAALADPWGFSYQYANPGSRSGGAFDLFSLGADGQPGGQDLEADIGNWVTAE